MEEEGRGYGVGGSRFDSEAGIGRDRVFWVAAEVLVWILVSWRQGNTF